MPCQREDLYPGAPMPAALPLAICWSDFSHHRWRPCLALDESNFASGAGAKKSTLGQCVDVANFPTRLLPTWPW